MNQGTLAVATLTDGSLLEYVVTENPPMGGMKYTYFTPDGSKVVQFFHDPQNEWVKTTVKRLEALVEKYAPALAEEKGGAVETDEVMPEGFRDRFCWPIALVRDPSPGVVYPAYSRRYFFTRASTPIEAFRAVIDGKLKLSIYFTSPSLMRYLMPSELGDLRSMLGVCLHLARAIRCMHELGLAHADLSCNNWLVDPQGGTSLVLDAEALIVPGFECPEVFENSKYMAPEIQEAMHLSPNDPARHVSSEYTNRHSMAVLIYSFLLKRHPLIGPKVHSTASVEEDEYMMYGPEALFVEHPTDHSNRPPNLLMTIKDLGAALEALFIRAFADGLHDPTERPTAAEWEEGLAQTLDMLRPCSNPDCSHKWFVLRDADRPVCPFCTHSMTEHS